MDNEQLYKRQNGNYKEVYPNTLLSSILDKESGKSLKDIISAHNHLYVPFINNIYETLTAIPIYIRRKGLWVTWETEDSIKTYQFELSTAEAANDAIWGNIESWTQVPDLDYYEHHAAVPDGSITLDKLSEELRDWLVNAGKIVNNPDNESIGEEHGVLKIANRPYNADTNSMGYVILNRNKSFAEQVTEENTIYEIRYKFNLEKQNVILPSGCILKFNGGKLSNGILNTNKCYIDSDLYEIFDNNLLFNNLNTYNNSLEVIDNIYIKILENDSFINKKDNTLISANTIINRRYVYKITDSNSSPIIGDNSVTIALNGRNYIVAKITTNGYKLVYDYTQVIGIDNTTGTMVDETIENFNDITFYSIEPLSYIYNSILKNKEIHPEWFGAKGNNNNDDSIAFNSALDLAWYSDSKVIVGNGVYKLNDTLIVHTHTNLIGNAPTAESPRTGCFSINTDIGILIFDRFNPSASFKLDNFGFIPFSESNKYNYIGIKIYHSQNYAELSNLGFRNPYIPIYIDSIGGVQYLNCVNINVYMYENRINIGAITQRCRLNGWFNANLFKFGYVGGCGGLDFNGPGIANVLEGGSCAIEGTQSFLISLNNQATLIVKGGLYKETGRFAKVYNSSTLVIEGNNHIIGSIDCDSSSYIKQVRTILNGTRIPIITNNITNGNLLIAHYTVFKKNPSLWYNTVNNSIVKFIESYNYVTENYNGRLYGKGSYKIPINDIDIYNKTVIFRVISTEGSASSNYYPINYNKNLSNSKSFVLSNRYSNTLILQKVSGGTTIEICPIERGEQFVFMPAEEESYVLKNISPYCLSQFLVSDIYILNINKNDIDNILRLKIINLLKALDSYSQDGWLLTGYNRGGNSNRPNLTTDDAGFQYFDTSLSPARPIWWNGTVWVDATGTQV